MRSRTRSAIDYWQFAVSYNLQLFRSQLINICLFRRKLHARLMEVAFRERARDLSIYDQLESIRGCATECIFEHPFIGNLHMISASQLRDYKSCNISFD